MPPEALALLCNVKRGAGSPAPLHAPGLGSFLTNGRRTCWKGRSSIKQQQPDNTQDFDGYHSFEPGHQDWLSTSPSPSPPPNLPSWRRLSAKCSSINLCPGHSMFCSLKQARQHSLRAQQTDYYCTIEKYTSDNCWQKNLSTSTNHDCLLGRLALLDLWGSRMMSRNVPSRNCAAIFCTSPRHKRATSRFGRIRWAWQRQGQQLSPKGGKFFEKKCCQVSLSCSTLIMSLLFLLLLHHTWR